MIRGSEPLAIALRVATGLLAAGLLQACAPGGAPGNDAGTGADGGADTRPAEGDVREGRLRLGILDESGDFEPLQPDDTVDIVVGFQGLLHVDLAATGPADMPRVVSGEADVHFDRSKFDFSDPKNRVHFDGDHKGRRLCDQFRVRFGLDLSQLEGKQVEVVAELEEGDWRGTGSTTFTIVDKK